MIKVEELVHAFVNQCCDFEKQLILTNHFLADWEADILLIDADGHSHEIEIKLSKSDFKNDFKKFYINHHTGQKFLKHEKIGCGDFACNAHSFLLPMGMIAENKIPKHCGIIEFYHDEDNWETSFRVMRQPSKIHQDSFWKLMDKDMFMRRMALNLLQRKFQIKSKTEELIFKNPFEFKK